jgi:nitrate reductase NapAB chaperone NapD
MNLSGIVVHVQPVCPLALRGRLADLSGMEIHAVREDGGMVISVEDRPETAPADLLERVRNLPDVFSAAMMYSYFGSMQQRAQQSDAGGQA